LGGGLRVSPGLRPLRLSRAAFRAPRENQWHEPKRVGLEDRNGIELLIDDRLDGRDLSFHVIELFAAVAKHILRLDQELEEYGVALAIIVSAVLQATGRGD